MENYRMRLHLQDKNIYENVEERLILNSSLSQNKLESKINQDYYSNLLFFYNHYRIVEFSKFLSLSKIILNTEKPIKFSSITNNDILIAYSYDDCFYIQNIILTQKNKYKTNKPVKAMLLLKDKRILTIVSNLYSLYDYIVWKPISKTLYEESTKYISNYSGCGPQTSSV